MALAARAAPHRSLAGLPALQLFEHLFQLLYLLNLCHHGHFEVIDVASALCRPLAPRGHVRLAEVVAYLLGHDPRRAGLIRLRCTCGPLVHLLLQLTVLLLEELNLLLKGSR